jgi:hypothetical protein
MSITSTDSTLTPTVLVAETVPAAAPSDLENLLNSGSYRVKEERALIQRRTVEPASQLATRNSQSGIAEPQLSTLNHPSSVLSSEALLAKGEALLAKEDQPSPQLSRLRVANRPSPLVEYKPTARFRFPSSP